MRVFRTLLSRQRRTNMGTLVHSKFGLDWRCQILQKTTVHLYFECPVTAGVRFLEFVTTLGPESYVELLSCWPLTFNLTQTRLYLP